jgi:integrase
MPPAPSSRPASGDVPIDAAIDRYLDSLSSDGSRTTMAPPLRGFAQHAREQGTNRVDDLEPATLREYGLTLRDRHTAGELQASTANTYFKYVRAFLSFCVRDELLDRNPAATTRATEFLPEDRGDPDRQFWTPEQRAQLIEYANTRVDAALEATGRDVNTVSNADSDLDTAPSDNEIDRQRAFRDRAIVILLADAGVRGAELFRDPRDADRDGVTWADLDLEHKLLRVFGKSRQYEDVALPEAARTALKQLRRVQEPPTDDWPIFPTGHAPSKFAAYREHTGEDPPDDADINVCLRDEAIAPPALTKAGGRAICKRLTVDAGIDVDDGYLKPHGARRALGADLYAAGHSELAQSALRHKSIETTHDAYADIQAADVADDIDAAWNDQE